MVKFISLSLLLLMMTLAQFATCQESPNCSRLEVSYSGPPFSGASLPVCVRDGLQCCTEEYIEAILNRTQELLPDGLRAELNRTIAIYARIIQRLQDFFEGDFLEQLYNRLTSNFLDSDQGNFRRNITEDLQDDFVIEEEEDDDQDESSSNSSTRRSFFRRFLDRVEDRAAAVLARTNEVQDCIRRVIDSSINQTRMQLVSDSIEQLRRSLTLGMRLLNFLENFRENLGGFRPLQQCVTTLVRLNYCSRCVQRTPPLCRNICGALARGCYSPFRTGLRTQFENLWNVTRQIVSLSRSSLQSLRGQLQRNLNVDHLALIREIASQCPVTIPGMRGRRQDDNGDDGDDDDDDDISDLPDEIDNDLRELNGGAFNYDRSGPHICRFLVNTAPSNCWDGTGVREGDIEEYTNDDIMGQANNPAIMLDETALTQQANSLGMPVNNILELTEFSEVSPEGLVVPGGEAIGTGGPGESGAGEMVVTLGMVLLAAVLAMKLQ